MESSNKNEETYIHNLSIFYGLDEDTEIYSIWLLLLLIILFNGSESEEKICTETTTDKICNKQT